MTDHFSNKHTFVEKLASAANATSSQPLFTCMELDGPQSRSSFHPTYIVPFGHFREIKCPSLSDRPPWEPGDRRWDLGADILADMECVRKLPSWRTNFFGSAKVAELGTIRMKNQDWKKWCPFMFQTCIWVGTATPGRGSQKRSTEYWQYWQTRTDDWQSGQIVAGS